VTAGTTAGSVADAPALGHDGRRDWLLVLDTATSEIVLAAAGVDGGLVGLATWEAGRTHGAQLLPAIGRLTGENNLRRSRIRGIVVGTGPGAFTGLRVGIATAKALAHELRVPIVGISTAEALLEASGAGDRGVLLLPAGPNDRHVIRRRSSPMLLPGGTEPEIGEGDVLVALDLADRAPADAAARGEAGRRGFAAALARMGAARLANGDADDLERLVPEYVSLPRGVAAETGEVAWSRDLR
jgi:tRNA threonylcarbamoyl adenosine modification protein YeaZ